MDEYQQIYSSDLEMAHGGFNAKEETSYSRLRRLSNLDHELISKSVHAGSIEKKQKISFLPIIVIIISGLFYVLPIMKLYPTEHTCISVLLFGALAWATEIIPSYATAYLVLGLSVWLQVGVKDGERISTAKLAETLSYKFMSPIILVFLGSLTISAALTKLEITDRVSAFFLSRIPPNTKIVLAVLMLINFFVASFLSNAASTTLVLTFSLPIIRSLEPDDPYIKAILIGLAWSGNAGGIPTLISSPQNIIATQYFTGKSISFFQWMGFGFPLAILVLVVNYLYLYFRFPAKQKSIDLMNNNNFEPWSWKHTLTCAVTVVTIILWALNDTLKKYLGHTGITAVIAVVILFGTGILDGSDFGSLRWSTLVLMGGGLALGEAMNLSGLLDLVSEVLSESLTSLSTWVLILIISIIECIVASVVNHTSAAAIVLPLLVEIGKTFGNTNALVAIATLMVSLSQLFHISSFPNALVSGVQRHSKIDSSKLMSESFLLGKDFFINGIPVAVISILLLVSVGYGIVMGMHLDNT